MNADLIKDTFSYFAKFPAKAGVMKNFTKNSSPIFNGYDNLKSDISNLAVHSLISGLNDYIFGCDVFAVIKRVEQVSGIYLFIDYGNIYDNLLEPMKTEQAEFVVAVTIARKTQPDDLDAIEQVLLADLCLGMITQLKDIAREDAKTNTFIKHFTLPADISPWFARDLFNSTGWTMTYKIKGIHLI